MSEQMTEEAVEHTFETKPGRDAGTAKAAKPEADGTSAPASAYTLTKRLVIVGALVGLVGGAVGSYAVIYYVAGGTAGLAKQQVVVQESSAVIDVSKKVSPSVVSITFKSTAQGIFGQSVEQDGAGTGMIVSSDGLILTNKHVVADTNATYSVITSDGKELKNARVVARDTINDIAFMRVDATGLPAVTLGDSSGVRVGQGVVAIGNALGQFQNSVTAGVISGIGRPVTAADDGTGENAESLSDLLQTDAAINPGNSGGPLVNLAGQVIGMNTAVAGQGSQNIGFAIPINDIKSLIDSVKNSGKIVRPYLGVRYVPLTSDVVSANNLKVNDGAWLHGDDQNPSVVDGSPAAAAGLKDGDIITKVGGTAITSTTSLQSLIASHKVGEKVPLTVVRSGKTITVTVTLAQAPTP